MGQRKAFEKEKVFKSVLLFIYFSAESSGSSVCELSSVLFNGIFTFYKMGIGETFHLCLKDSKLIHPLFFLIQIQI